MRVQHLRKRSISRTLKAGLRWFRQRLPLYWGLNAAASSSSVQSGATKVKSMPIFFMVTEKKVKCAAVDGGGCNDMIPAICNIEYGVEICRLSGGGQHCCCAAFQRSNFAATRSQVGFCSLE